MSPQNDIERLALQEEQLQFTAFDANTALDVGLRLKMLIEARGKQAAIEVQVAGQRLFFYSMQGATPANANWVRRKCNTVMHFLKSSYAVSQAMQANGFALSRYGLEGDDYVWAGGGFPIRLRGTGVIGAIAVSGLPEREDHGVIVEVLTSLLGQSIDALALTSSSAS